jgi:transposase
MSITNAAAEPEYAALVAIDWADKEHAWAMEVVGSGKREAGKLEHTPEAIEAWAVSLAVRFESRPVAVALEQAHGALLYALMKYAHLVLYPIHPARSASYRSAMFPSGGKNDPVDAELLLDLLVRQRDRLRVLRPDTEPTRKLQALVEKRRQVVDEQTAQTNRLTDRLKLYFPQALRWIDELSSPIGVAFLERWPTLQQLQQEDPAQVRQFFYAHGSRSRQRIEARLAEIAQARPAIEDRAIIDPCVLVVQVLLKVVTALREGIAQLQQACEEAFAAHPDAPIFASFPGAGKVMAPRLLAAFGSQRDRWSSVAEFQPYTGIPPITVRSGNSESVHFRWACAKFLRQTFHEFAALSIQWSEWARAFYEHKREVERMDHHAAVRSLAYKWQRILFRCWKQATPYQESVYQDRLLQRASAVPAAAQTVAAAAGAAPTRRSSPKPGRGAPPTKRDRQRTVNPVPFVFKKVAGFCKLSEATS